MLKKYSSFYIIASALFLSACGSLPTSYLPAQSTPIVNVEANIATQLKINATSQQLDVTNLTTNQLSLLYLLVWYDRNGVTQTLTAPNEDNTLSNWDELWLAPQEKKAIKLIKPTAESENYRIYLRQYVAQ